MVLSRSIARLATHAPRPYVVEAPGGAAVRAAVEAELDRRGWATAEAAASADALVVAGPLPETLRTAADLVWSQLPGPRARASVRRTTDAADALEALRAELRDGERQHADAAERPRDAVTPWLPEDDGDDDDHGGHDHGGHDHGGHDHGGHDHGGHDHGGHDHGAMAPGGIPLAGGDDDRDGLEMDVLAHPLGPLLDRWPGGLELRVVLHGDAVGNLEVRWWDPAEGAADVTAPAWAAYDAVATTLSLAGDLPGARLARSLRDGDPAETRPGTARLARRVERWRRWSVLPRDCAHALTGLLTAGEAGPPDPLDDAALADLLRGRDLADVRLLVASLTPRLRRAGTTTPGVRHG